MINLKNLTPNSIVIHTTDKLNDVLETIDNKISKKEYESGMSSVHSQCIYISVRNITYGDINNVEINILNEYFKYLGWDYVKIDSSSFKFDLHLYKNEKTLNRLISENISKKSNDDNNIEFLSLDDFIKTQMKK